MPDNADPTPPAQPPGEEGASPWTHVYRWKSRRPDYHGRRCRVLARGALNSVLIELEPPGAGRVGGPVGGPIAEQDAGLFAREDEEREHGAGPHHAPIDRAPRERARPERAVVSRWALRALAR